MKDVIGGSVADERAKQKRYTEVMKKFNEMIANHPHLESVLVPIGDGMTISKVKK
ncbi:methyltransferase [Bacillus cereus]|nr:methyltransferase [Bacillus cereus]MDA2708462.1 methyltransferase [Bacillus cereus]